MNNDISLRECQSRDVLLCNLLKGTKFENQISTLRNLKCCSALEVIIRSEVLKNFSQQDKNELLGLCGKIFAPAIETSLSMQTFPRISWGCRLLDPMFGGGLLMHGVVEIAGAAGSGKTQNCLWLAYRCLLENPSSTVAYISTEGEFPVKRFCQFAAGSLDDAESRVMVEKVSSFDDLWKTLTTRIPIMLVKMKVKLIIIDSIGALRADYDKASNDRSEVLWKIGQYLKWLNDRYECGVLVTNQVIADMNSGIDDAVIPALGLVWSNIVNTRMILRKTKMVSEDTVVREMKVTICPYLPVMDIPFIVGPNSIKGTET